MRTWCTNEITPSTRPSSGSGISSCAAELSITYAHPSRPHGCRSRCGDEQQQRAGDRDQGVRRKGRPPRRARSHVLSGQRAPARAPLRPRLPRRRSRSSRLRTLRGPRCSVSLDEGGNAGDPCDRHRKCVTTAERERPPRAQCGDALVHRRRRLVACRPGRRRRAGVPISSADTKNVAASTAKKVLTGREGEGAQPRAPSRRSRGRFSGPSAFAPCTFLAVDDRRDGAP